MKLFNNDTLRKSVLYLWDVFKIKIMYVLSYVTQYNGNSNNWNIEHIVDMRHLFENPIILNINSDNWNVGHIANMHYLLGEVIKPC